MPVKDSTCYKVLSMAYNCVIGPPKHTSESSFQQDLPVLPYNSKACQTWMKLGLDAHTRVRARAHTHTKEEREGGREKERERERERERKRERERERDKERERVAVRLWNAVPQTLENVIL